MEEPRPAALDEALCHVARGWATLPVDQKRPAGRLIRRTRGSSGWGQLRSSPAGEDEVRAWFELDPGTGIGVLTGEASGGLAVVDVDDPTRAPELPATASVTTGRCAGARHDYFHSDGPVRSREFAWGELRGEGEYVVAPDSPHKSGHRYRWQLTPEETGGLTNLAETKIAARPAQTQNVSKSLSSEASDFESLITNSCSTCQRDKRTDALRVTGFSSYVLLVHPLSGLERNSLCAARLAVALGAPEDVRLGVNFPCVLHPETSPSATLWRVDEGAHVLYRDFHASRHGGEAWLPLPLVRARQAGRQGALGRPEFAIWKLRLAAEAGFLEPAVLDADSPSLPPHLRALWCGFLDLLALRWAVDPGKPAPFSAGFAAAWCGVSKTKAHGDTRELQRLGLLRVVGRDPEGTRLWLPSALVQTTKEMK